MAEKMTRRTFMKSAAAAAVAVSLSGVLAGCGESGLGQDEVQAGEFVVKVYDAKGSRITDTDETETCQITAKVRMTYKGNSTGITEYKTRFGGSVGNTPLTVSASSNSFIINTTPVASNREGNADLVMTFPSAEAYEEFLNGMTVVVTVAIGLNPEAKLYLTKSGKNVVVTNTMPTV